jgi:hypothetical protein
MAFDPIKALSSQTTRLRKSIDIEKVLARRFTKTLRVA